MTVRHFFIYLSLCLFLSLSLFLCFSIFFLYLLTSSRSRFLAEHIPEFIGRNVAAQQGCWKSITRFSCWNTYEGFARARGWWPNEIIEANFTRNKINPDIYKKLQPNRKNICWTIIFSTTCNVLLNSFFNLILFKHLYFLTLLKENKWFDIKQF